MIKRSFVLLLFCIALVLAVPFAPIAFAVNPTVTIDRTEPSTLEVGTQLKIYGTVSPLPDYDFYILFEAIGSDGQVKDHTWLPIKKGFFQGFLGSVVTDVTGKWTLKAGYSDDKAVYPSTFATREVTVTGSAPPPVKCSKNSDCGEDSYIDYTLYCKGNDVCRKWIRWSCIYPGTSSSDCTYTYDDKVQRTCSGGMSCSNGDCLTATSCTPSWHCTAWGSCSSEGRQSRSCTDLNLCGNSANKPVESQSCDSSGQSSTLAIGTSVSLSAYSSSMGDKVSIDVSVTNSGSQSVDVIVMPKVKNPAGQVTTLSETRLTGLKDNSGKAAEWSITPSAAGNYYVRVEVWNTAKTSKYYDSGYTYSLSVVQTEPTTESCLPCPDTCKDALTQLYNGRPDDSCRTCLYDEKPCAAGCQNDVCNSEPPACVRTELKIEPEQTSVPSGSQVKITVRFMEANTGVALRPFGKKIEFRSNGEKFGFCPTAGGNCFVFLKTPAVEKDATVEIVASFNGDNEYCSVTGQSTLSVTSFRTSPLRDKAIAAIGSLEKGLTESASQIDGTVPTNTAVVLSKCLLGALHSSSDVEEKVVLDFANNAVATAGGQIYQITFTPHLIKDTYDTLVLPHLAQIKLHNLENPYIPEEKQNTEFVQDTEDYIQFIEDRGTRFPETISNLIDSHGRKSLFQTVILTGGGLVLAYVSTGPAAPFTVGSMFSLENCVLNIVSNDDFNGLLVALAKSHGEESIGYAEGISSALSYIKRKIESGDYEFPKIVVDLPGKGTISIGNKFQKPLKVRVFSHTLMGPKQAVGVCPKNKFDFYSRYQDAELQPGDHLQFFSYMLTDSGQDELDKWLVSMAAEGYEEVGTETVYYVNYGEGALQAMKEIRAGCSTIPAGCSGMVSDKVCPQGCLYRDVDCGTSSTETICGKKDSVCPSSCGENNDPDCCKPPSNWVEGYGCCPQGGTCGTLGNCFMQCPDKCDGKKRLFNGEQNTGCTECEYKEEDCGYECSEGKCVSKPTTYGPPQSQKDLTIQNVKISKGKPIEVSADILVPNDFKKQLEQTAIYASDIYPYVINIKAEVYKKSCFLFICKQDKEVYQKTFNYLSCGTGCLTRIDDMEFPNNFEKELTEINEPGDYYVKLSLVQTVPYASAGGPLSEKDQAISESVSDNFRIEGIPVTGQVTKVSGEPTWWQKVFGLFS